MCLKYIAYALCGPRSDINTIDLKIGTFFSLQTKIAESDLFLSSLSLNTVGFKVTGFAARLSGKVSLSLLRISALMFSHDFCNFLWMYNRSLSVYLPARPQIEFMVEAQTSVKEPLRNTGNSHFLKSSIAVTAMRKEPQLLMFFLTSASCFDFMMDYITSSNPGKRLWFMAASVPKQKPG